MYNIYGRSGTQLPLMSPQQAVIPSKLEVVQSIPVQSEQEEVQTQLEVGLSDRLLQDLATAVPTANELVTASMTLESLTKDQIEEVCAMSSQFRIGKPILAKEFLSLLLIKIEQQYQEDMEAVNVARTVSEVMGWLVGAGAVVASVLGTPAMGLAVETIGGVTVGVANEIINKIADGIERGDVDPAIIDKLSMISKDQLYFEKFYEKFYEKSLEEIESLIVRSYRTYQEILLIPEIQILNVLKFMGHESMEAFYIWGAEQGNSIQSTDEFIQSMMDGFLTPNESMSSFPYYASKAEIEIILVVLCQLYQERQQPSSVSDGTQVVQQYNGDKFKLTPLLVGLAVGIGTFLV